MGLFGGGGLGGFISSAVETVGDFIPGIGDSRAQEKANKININEAAKNREFQERMSSTAYQRAMDDMRKAGLNPTLAYMQGGASAPSGATAQVQSAPKTALADMALKATTGIGGLSQQSTALQQQQNMNESTIQLQAANAAKAVADTERARAETKGLGRKEEEGKLWKKFYKGINTILDSSAKDKHRRIRVIDPKTPMTPDEKKRMDYLMKATKSLRKQRN